MEIKYIGIFGKRNSGKSSLINFLMEEDVAIVSDVAGTTTDPVKKRLEIFGVGPVVLVDTAGYDDEGEVGEKRVKKTKDIVGIIDAAILLYTGNLFDKEDREILKMLKRKNIPVIVLHNQSDIVSLDNERAEQLNLKYSIRVKDFSCNIIDQRNALQARSALIKDIINILTEKSDNNKTILQGLVQEGKTIVLVCPIDDGAPTGRLILPQVLAIRDILDRGGISVVMQPDNLSGYLSRHSPSLIITDSQVFAFVNKVVPSHMPLTSFSMLLARSKGPFNAYLDGTPKIEKLKGNVKILILESCSHHKSCDDIGRVKLPMMFKKYLGENTNPEFTFVQALDPIPNEHYNLAVQCGGCMVTSVQLNNRMHSLIERGIPVTNYGMAMAFMQGIYNRVIKPLK